MRNQPFSEQLSQERNGFAPVWRNHMLQAFSTVPSDLAERSVSFRAGADPIIDALLRNATATPLLRKEGRAASLSC